MQVQQFAGLNHGNAMWGVEYRVWEWVNNIAMFRETKTILEWGVIQLVMSHSVWAHGYGSSIAPVNAVFRIYYMG